MNRRQFLATLGTGTLTLAGCTGSTADPDATPTPRPDEPLEPVAGTWSTYQYDAARTGYNPSRGTPHEERSGHWSADIGEAGDRVTVADGTIYVGDVDGTLYGLESTTGSKRWSLDLLSRENGNEVPWETMTVSDGTLFTGNTMELHAVDLESREIGWSVEFEGEVPHGETVLVDDVVVAQLGRGTVAGLDASTGNIR